MTASPDTTRAEPETAPDAASVDPESTSDAASIDPKSISDAASAAPESAPGAASTGSTATALGAVLLGGIVTAVLRPVALKKVEALAVRKLRTLDALFSRPC